MKHLFNSKFNGRSVLITGHTGFKGSWLAIWLKELGANIIGYSLDKAPTDPSNYIAADVASHITDIRGDIRDYDKLLNVIETHQPEIIFHLAAQPIVLRSVSEPKLTVETNVVGTLNVLEAIRNTDCVRALVSITTDKVYHNEEWLWGYRETDKLGGHDPYSASKAMAELIISSYRDTYFPVGKYDDHGVAIASVRAGNVVGGGDFAQFRLVPDCMKALMDEHPIGIRNPLSVRPWQLVLEPLSGYLWLAAKLRQEGTQFAEAWNFGPVETVGIPAQTIVEKLIELWGSGSWAHTELGYAKVETGYLRLSWEKAAFRLGWQPVYAWEDTLAEIVDWFKAFERSVDEASTDGASVDMYAVCRDHIAAYAARAIELRVDWASGG